MKMKRIILTLTMLVALVATASAQAEIKFDKLIHNFGSFEESNPVQKRSGEARIPLGERRLRGLGDIGCGLPRRIQDGEGSGTGGPLLEVGILLIPRTLSFQVEYVGRTVTVFVTFSEDRRREFWVVGGIGTVLCLQTQPAPFPVW